MTMTGSPVQNLRLPRAKLVAGEATWAKMRVVLNRGTLRVFDSSGELHLEREVSGTQVAGAGTWELTMDDGEVWTVTKLGCGCGGGG